MKTATASASLMNFLRQDVPPTGTPEWRAWSKKCTKEFGNDHLPSLLDVLKTGSAAEQYAALLVLRAIGYEAYGRGYGKSLAYTVKVGTKTRRIRPNARASAHA